MDPPPRFPDSSVRDRVRELLTAVGYGEEELHRRLPTEETGRPSASLRRRLQEGLHELDDALGILLRVFFLGHSESEEELASGLGSEAVEALLDSGLLVTEGPSLRATAQLSPIEDLVVAADRPDRHGPGATDFVVGPFGATRDLATWSMRRPVTTVLDLGCGSGALGALATSHAGWVVATDINPRALDFTRFNAELNGLETLDVREGSLFEPVAESSFDLILSNPPYVISPARTFTYRDGGTEICRRIVREAPTHLSERGYLQMRAEWPERRSRDWREEVESWIDGLACDVWVLRKYSFDPLKYAKLWLKGDYGGESPPPEVVGSWRRHLESQGVASVGGGLLTLRHSRGRRPIRTLRDAPRSSAGRARESLEEWISAQTLLSSLSTTEEILDLPLLPVPGLESIQRRTVEESGWTIRRRELRRSEGLRFGAKVDPVTEEIVGLLDGVRTPRQALEVFAERHGVGTAPFLGGLPDALAGLLELGLVVPVGDAAAP